MMAREFLKELEKTRELFRWEYLEDNRIRGFLKQELDKNDGPSKGFDPIAAVAHARTRATAHRVEVETIDEGIGLSALDCESIRAAANDVLWKYVDGELVLDGYCQWLREGVVLAVGLAPYDFDAPRMHLAAIPVAVESAAPEERDLEPQRL